MALSVTASWAALADPAIQTVYNSAPKVYPPKYDKVFEVKKTTRPDIKSRSWAGFGLAQVKAEGGSIPFTSPTQGFAQTVYTTVYGLGFIVSREMIEDDQHNVVIKEFPKALRKSVDASIETIAATIIDRAFNASYVGNDGLSLCSTAHKMVTGGTFSNMLTTSADLDMTSLEEMMTVVIPSLTDDANIVTPVNAKRLLVAPSNAWVQSVLLKSTGNPESANRGINPAQGIMPEETIIWNFLTDPDAWFILTDASNGLSWHWQRRPDFSQDHDTDSENAKWKSTFRSAALWDNPRCIVGSAGA